MIGGVAGGLAEYFGIDPVVVRVGFASPRVQRRRARRYVVMLVVVPRDDRRRGRAGVRSPPEPGGAGQLPGGGAPLRAAAAAASHSPMSSFQTSGAARDEGLQEVDALLRVEVDDRDAVLAQPVDPALEGPRLADHDDRDAELADQAAAVPARRERRDHHGVAVGAAAARRCGRRRPRRGPRDRRPARGGCARGRGAGRRRRRARCRSGCRPRPARARLLERDLEHGGGVHRGRYTQAPRERANGAPGGGAQSAAAARRGRAGERGPGAAREGSRPPVAGRASVLVGRQEPSSYRAGEASIRLKAGRSSATADDRARRMRRSIGEAFLWEMDFRRLRRGCRDVRFGTIGPAPRLGRAGSRPRGSGRP